MKESQQSILSVEDLSKSFGSRRVLSGVSFSVDRSEMLGIVGPSGGGKSVLLKILGSVIPADSGKVVFHNVGDLKPSLGFSFQEGALFDSLSVLENVAFPITTGGFGLFKPSDVGTSAMKRPEALERAYKMLAQVGLGRAYRKYPSQLSGGMRRRVALARALVSEPQIALLDDPTAGLDPVTSSSIIALIKELRDQIGSTMIIVSQDLRRLIPSVDRLIALFDGKVAVDCHVHDIENEAPEMVVSFLSRRFDFGQFSTASPIGSAETGMHTAVHHN